jgi:hypothetical protein
MQIIWEGYATKIHNKIMVSSIQCFQTNILYAFHISPMDATCPTYLILLDLITVTISGVV